MHFHSVTSQSNTERSNCCASDLLSALTFTQQISQLPHSYRKLIFLVFVFLEPFHTMLSRGWQLYYLLYGLHCHNKQLLNPKNFKCCFAAACMHVSDLSDNKMYVMTILQLLLECIIISSIVVFSL